jgi:hypothetical protein
MDTCRFCVEFTVPENVGIQEWPQGERTTDPAPNPVLEHLRAALEADERVHLRRVAPVIRVGDHQRQQLLVYVQVFCPTRHEGLQAAQEAVSDVVAGVIPSATFYGIEDEIY